MLKLKIFSALDQITNYLLLLNVDWPRLDRSQKIGKLVKKGKEKV